MSQKGRMCTRPWCDCPQPTAHWSAENPVADLHHAWQLVHTSTLQLAKLLVTKTIVSETMGNSQLITNNFCLNSAVDKAIRAPCSSIRRVFCILPPVNVKSLQMKTLRRWCCLLRQLQIKILTWQSCQPQATTNKNTLAVFSGNTNTNTNT